MLRVDFYVSISCKSFMTFMGMGRREFHVAGPNDLGKWLDIGVVMAANVGKILGIFNLALIHLLKFVL